MKKFKKPKVGEYVEWRNEYGQRCCGYVSYVYVTTNKFIIKPTVGDFNRDDVLSFNVTYDENTPLHNNIVRIGMEIYSGKVTMQ